MGAIGLGAAGLVLGFVVGRMATSAGGSNAADSHAVSQADLTSSTLYRPDHGGTEEATRIVLGNIISVPFQELYSVLSARPASELAELARQLESLPAGHEKDQKSAKFFKAWAHFDPTAAMKAAIALETPKARSNALHSVIEGSDSAAGETLAKAIGALAAESLPPHVQRGLVGQATTKWSEVDAAAAAAFIDTIPVTPGNVFADLHSIAQNWALSDPQAALAWAQQHDRAGPSSMSFATNGAISGWWQKDPAAAEAYVASHLETLPERQLASSLASNIFQTDPKQAIEWVNQLPDVEARRQADSLIAHQMAWTDQKAAAEWASNLPANVRSTALDSAVNMWAQKDPNSAGEWIGSLNGAVRDQAVSGYSSAVATKDPVNAMAWATTISDPRMRDTSTDRIVRSWMQRNATEATAWVQASALSDEQKKRLLATPPGG